MSVALRKVGIEHLAHKVCHYLSGGEKRKVALAGALVLEPELLVLDESRSRLDPSSRNDIVDLLNRLNREHGVSLVVATHDAARATARGQGVRAQAAARSSRRARREIGATSSCSSARVLSKRRCSPSCWSARVARREPRPARERGGSGGSCCSSAWGGEAVTPDLFGTGDDDGASGSSSA